MNDNRTEQFGEKDSPQGRGRDLVCVAAIAGAFGVRGEVRLKPFTDDPAACVSYGPLYDEAGKLIMTPKSSRPVKGGLAVTAPEIKNREAAEALKSTRLYVPRNVLPSAGEDEFYYVDLIGLRVEDEDGHVLGRIKAVHDFGAGDILEIQTPSARDWYHPFTQAGVPLVDIKGGRVVIILPDQPEESD